MSQVFEPVPDSQQNPKPASERPSLAHASTPSGGGPRRKSHAVRNTILILILAALTAYGIRALRSPTAARGGPDAAKQFPVPVVAGAVMQKDVPIFLDGLGTVQALNTVTVRARVDGELKKVSFTEGQDVKAGDVLAQIDDAPFRALFEQAQAKKGQDEAQLANAKLDLERNADLIAKKVISPQQYETQKALVLLGVQQSYLNVLRLQQLSVLQKENVLQRETTVRQAKLFVEGQLKSGVDLQLSQANAAEATKYS